MITLSTLDDIFAAGFECGWQEGYERGADDWAKCTELWLGVVREGLKLPRQEELVETRAYTDEPCTRPTCGICSRCVRAAAAQRNLCRYGSPDYPGVQEADRQQASFIPSRVGAS